MEPFANPIEHMQALLARLDLLLRRQVLRLRAARLLTDDEFRGLYIPDQQVDELLRPAATAETDTIAALSTALQQLDVILSERTTPGLPLPRLQAAFGLSAFECDVLLIAAAVELDLRYETIYGYVQNDVTKKRPTVDLALKLLCCSFEERVLHRSAFDPAAALFRDQLLEFVAEPQNPDPPLPARFLRAGMAVVDFLLGQPRLDERLRPFCTLHQGVTSVPVQEPEGRAVWFLHGPAGTGKRAAAADGAALRGAALLVADLRVFDLSSPLPAALLRREVSLHHACICLEHWEAALEAEPRARAALIAAAAGLVMPNRPLFLTSEQPWHPGASWPHAVFLAREFSVPSMAGRRACWASSLNGHGAPALEISGLAAKFSFTPGQIETAVREARHHAAGRDLTADDLHRAARAQSSHVLQRFAQTVRTAYRWEDLVLPPRQTQQLREILQSVRRRELVFSEWGFDEKLSHGKGVSVLFSGQSGTGKTMAASIIGRELGLDLYKIDLAGVVSKYIGETEKNLAAIFQQAQSSNSILFFDEADALFGKRSEVKDAHDRYANLEVAYLLQRMEEHEGVVILATNLGKNLDEAFARRIQHTVDFPFPEAIYRERIWRGAFPTAAPLDDSIDFQFLARQFQLAGGNIRNITVAAAFQAADADSPIRMEHIILATSREFQKIGRLPSRADFGRYYELIRERA